MRTRWLLAVLGLLLVGCGGKGGPAPPPVDPADRERKDAAASVQRLSDAVGAADLRAACRSLTLATRRVVAEVGEPGATCTSGLLGFLGVHGLRSTLPEVKRPSATVTGDRALVLGAPLSDPLAAVRNDGGWRVSLVGLPGVRADVKAARACGRWLDKADALDLPPFERGALVAKLRSQARLVDGLRLRLRALPLTEGPPRTGLLDLTRSLKGVRDGLRLQARKVAGGRDVAAGMQAYVRVDRFVRETLRRYGSTARVACPRDITDGPEAPARRRSLDRACRSLERVVDKIGRGPATKEQSDAEVRSFDAALERLDGKVAKLRVPRGLERIRRQTRTAIARTRTELQGLLGADSLAAYDRFQQAGLGYANRIDAGIVRLGATCLDPPSKAPKAANAPDLTTS